MSQLLALSYDAPSSPSITLKATRKPGAHTQPYGWGMGWYPPESRAAMVVKDPTSIGDNVMTQVLRDWARFHSTTFICHLRGAAQRISQENTHPFTRTYGARSWIFTHNGFLRPGFAQSLPLGQNPIFEPMGRTDTEHIMCWLLGRMRELNLRTLAEVEWGRLYEWFSELNRLGTMNVVVSDGDDLVIYEDANGFNPLHWARLRPPHSAWELENDEVHLELGGPADIGHTALILATQPLQAQGWERMKPGQLMVVRRAGVQWDSYGVEGQGIRRVPAEPAAASAAASAASNASAQALRRQTPRLYRLTHRTVYRYARPIEKSHHVYRLQPVHDPHQDVLEYKLEISPEGLRQDFDDVFGNHSTSIDLDTPFTELSILSQGLVRVKPVRRGDMRSPARHSTIPLVWMPWQRQMMNPYLLPPELPATQLAELFDYAMSFVERQDYGLVETLVDMNLTIYRDYAYVSGSTTLETTPFDVYLTRRGVCQDFANLLICMARLIGVPARYRVGYIYTGADYENKVQSDASHAWVELYLPWCGWRGFDPTNGCLANTDHLLIACGRHYRDATPTSGTIYRGGGGETLQIDVRVEPVDEPSEIAACAPSPNLG